MLNRSPAIDFVTGYLHQVCVAYPDGDDLDDVAEVKLVLQTFRHALSAHGKDNRVCLKTLASYKKCFRTAQVLLGGLLDIEAAAFASWSPGEAVQNEQQRFSLILGWVMAEISMIIYFQERKYPEMRDAFNLERQLQQLQTN